MKILALDTTSSACSVACYGNGQITARFVQAERGHTHRLLPMVDEVLADAGVVLSDLDALAVSHGPGSFTGLRIAISCAQGLAYSADIPVVPVSSLSALALGARRTHPEWGGAPIVSVLDARMGQVYWGVFTAQSPHHSLLPEAVTSPEQMVLSLQKATLPAPLYGAGPGWHYNRLRAVPVAGIDQNTPVCAEDILQLAMPLWQAGVATTAEALEPRYLRNEITWQKRQKIRSR
ncbi:tRNA (adenosine(37)-N6)-threonylcarbamoyltransferase complex dimerization subunit type 1 TsaB [Microbulbifer sp. 2205BS26-8]|uniref:tRNA (adenosine(37)-N6)-threonylcarbamoyltransferase complex dimerization subunit type 1 TsaB n=1 Tax=Microbulbifer sp. 2205BS26-8 TaxID=3064386 RepID=UPI00273F1BEA|nr:tRNA (adenosine(37)-N6)-threonylcarbamoyltransferase complex dimerization subunit type 1 TsaB [Microbulbifer sp. 2205BS26-8]MDP5208728.1 tRNA (adenosine(37)-N6)-threonylcarbamoyltransferase complex dimerization subunit type 1 TsaB [Microbulbifer sp. 2205BS26-8]